MLEWVLNTTLHRQIAQVNEHFESAPFAKINIHFVLL